VSDVSSSGFGRDSFVTALSAEEQPAVHSPIELVRPEHIILGHPPEIGRLSGMDQVAVLRGELDSLWEDVPNHSRLEDLLGSAGVEELATTRPLFGRRMKVRFPGGAASAIHGRSNVDETLARLDR